MFSFIVIFNLHLQKPPIFGGSRNEYKLSLMAEVDYNIFYYDRHVFCYAI